MFYHYCTIGEDIEVVHTPLNNKGQTLVHIEIPDPKYCFRTMDCLIPTYRVSNIVGMKDDEIAFYVEFCKRNAHLLLKYAALGGIANA